MSSGEMSFREKCLIGRNVLLGEMSYWEKCPREKCLRENCPREKWLLGRNVLHSLISYAHDIQFPDLPIQCELWDLSIEHVFQLNHLEAKKLQLHTEADQLPILRVEIWIISSKPEEKWQKCWLLLSSCSPSISSLYTFCQYYRYISQYEISEVS